MPGFTSVVSSFVNRFPGAARIVQNSVYLTTAGVIGLGVVLGVNHFTSTGHTESHIVTSFVTKETGTGGINGTGAGLQIIAGATDDGSIFTKSGSIILGPLSSPHCTINNDGTTTGCNFGGGTSTFGTGNVITVGDTRYLRTAGGTMTGVETINISGGAKTTIGIDNKNSMAVAGFYSGAYLHIQGLASYILGTLAIGRNAIAHTGDQMEVQGTLSGQTVIGTTLSGTIIRYRIESPRILQVEPFGSGSSVATGSGKVEMIVDPITMSGMKLTGGVAQVLTAGTTNATTVQIRDVTKGNTKLLSTPFTIDSGTKSSRLSGTQPAFAGTVLSGYDTLSIDIPAVSTTAPQGLVIDLVFTK